MKKNTLTFIIFVLLGLLAGSIIGQLLSPVGALSFLSKSAQISWHPQADFDIVKYDFFIQVKLNVLSIIGIVLALWIYRKI